MAAMAQMSEDEIAELAWKQLGDQAWVIPAEWAFAEAWAVPADAFVLIDQPGGGPA
jgi:hypothetical protein